MKKILKVLVEEEELSGKEEENEELPVKKKEGEKLQGEEELKGEEEEGEELPGNEEEGGEKTWIKEDNFINCLSNLKLIFTFFFLIINLNKPHIFFYNKIFFLIRKIIIKNFKLKIQIFIFFSKNFYRHFDKF